MIRPKFYTGLHTGSEIQDAFDAGISGDNSFPGQRVNDILDGYMTTLRYCHELTPLNLLVVTDDEIADRTLLNRTVKGHLKSLMEHGHPVHQLGIEFIQVGDCKHVTPPLVELLFEVGFHHCPYGRDFIDVTLISKIGHDYLNELWATLVGGIDARMHGYIRRSVAYALGEPQFEETPRVKFSGFMSPANQQSPLDFQYLVRDQDPRFVP